jgi:rhodanese-related sulfurtransferase
MTHRYKKALHILLLISLFAGFSAIASASDVPKISKEELNAMLGDPGLVIIDVRRERDWKSSSLKIRGAVWEDFLDVDIWAQKYPKNKTIVLYCD